MAMLGLIVDESSDTAAADEFWTTAEPTQAAPSRMDRINVGLTLVNWMVLLLMMCALLLAWTLPKGSDVIGGVASVTCVGKTCTPVEPAN